MNQVLVGLGDVDKNSSQKLQGVEVGLIVDLVPSFGLVEDELGVWVNPSLDLDCTPVLDDEESAALGQALIDDHGV